jgi:glycosyltransferase involved in cell wall biosynthesis
LAFYQKEKNIIYSKPNESYHKSFLASEREHILMITNHGIHQWEVVPGLPDTGGQNVFVNQFTDTLAEMHFKITIVNRGGYAHPLTGEARSGLHYKNAWQRILYAEDEIKEFVRKEDMHEQIPKLAAFVKDFLQEEGTGVDLIISHYWDAAKIGVFLNQQLPQPVTHVWVPHSLGAIKKRNMPPETWQELRIDERIAAEQELMPALDAVAATSSLIQSSLEDDYGYHKILFLPPCVKTERYYPRYLSDDHKIWQFLAQHVPFSAAEVRQKLIITEISRTDKTKRKDVLIKAFARVHERYPNTMLAVSIDQSERVLAADLYELIRTHHLEDHTAVLGYVWDELPDLYAATAVYCSPSVMEGFGMSVQEAAATKVPIVASDLVPFVKEYLLGDEIIQISYDGMDEMPMLQGAGAFVVRADDVDGFAEALQRLIADEGLRQEMGERAYDITLPYFTWKNMTARFVETVKKMERADV